MWLVVDELKSVFDQREVGEDGTTSSLDYSSILLLLDIASIISKIIGELLALRENGKNGTSFTLD